MKLLKEKAFETKPLIEPILYHGLMDLTHMGLWIWHIQKEYVEISSILCRMLDMDAKITTFTTTEWMTKWHPNEKELLRNELSQAINNGSSNLQVVHRLKNDKDNYIWIHTKAYIVRDEEQKPLQMLGISIDFSEFQETLESLSEEKEMYHNYLSASKAATWWWNVETGETKFDESWANILGYSLKELEPISIQTWKKLTHEQDLKETSKVLDQVFNKKLEFYDATFRMKHKDGRYVWISDRGKVMSWLPNGKPHIMIGTHIDVTKEKELELVIQNKESYYRNLLESSYDIVYSLDMDYKFTYISPTWNEKLGYDINVTIKQSFEPYLYHEDLPKIMDFFLKIYHKKERHEVGDFRLIHKDGSIRWFTTNATILLDDDKNPIGFVGSARDITEEKAYQLAILKEKELFQKTLMSLGDGIVTTDYEGNVTFMNPIIKSLFCSKDDCMKHIDQIFNQIHTKKHIDFSSVRDKIIGQLKSQVYIEGHIINHNIYVEGVLSTIENEKDHIEGFSLIIRDQTDKHQKQEEIEWLIHHDYLSGLYNRRYIEENLDLFDDQIYSPLGVMMLDVNGLKRMNDVHGHQVGDELIAVVADTLLETISKKDTVARIGGDEFLIIRPNTTTDEMYDFKYNLLESFKHRIIKGNRVSVALGYAIKEKDDKIRDVMKIADDYMYMNKNSQIK